MPTAAGGQLRVACSPAATTAFRGGGSLMRTCRIPFSLLIATAVLVGCDTRPPLEPSRVPTAPNMAKGGPTTGSQFATLAKLAPIKGGGHGEAYAVNRTGSIV